MYTSLWVWILLMSAVTCTIAAERAYIRAEMMENITELPLVIAKVAGELLFHLSITGFIPP